MASHQNLLCVLCTWLPVTDSISDYVGTWNDDEAVSHNDPGTFCRRCLKQKGESGRWVCRHGQGTQARHVLRVTCEVDTSHSTSAIAGTNSMVADQGMIF